MFNSMCHLDLISCYLMYKKCFMHTCQRRILLLLIWGCNGGFCVFLFVRDGMDTGLVDAMESNENDLGSSEAGKQKPSLMFKIASRSILFYYFIVINCLFYYLVYY